MNQAADQPRLGFFRRFSYAVPGFWTALIGGEIWAALMAVSALLGLWMRAWETPASIEQIMKLYALGGFLAFPIGLYLARLLAGRRRGAKGFTCALVAFAITTVGLTALVFAIVYRVYYSEWHDDEFSIRLIFEIAFTTAAAMYQFAVLGLRLYFPIGVAALIGASLWFARQPD